MKTRIRFCLSQERDTSEQCIRGHVCFLVFIYDIPQVIMVLKKLFCGCQQVSDRAFNDEGRQVQNSLHNAVVLI